MCVLDKTPSSSKAGGGAGPGTDRQYEYSHFAAERAGAPACPRHESGPRPCPSALRKRGKYLPGLGTGRLVRLCTLKCAARSVFAHPGPDMPLAGCRCTYIRNRLGVVLRAGDWPSIAPVVPGIFPFGHMSLLLNVRWVWVLRLGGGGRGW